MSLSPGTRFGPYQVVAALGSGGMGEVYRATDTKLHRDVALKVLLDLFANDPERLARFEREAHVLASLNHPHIAAIHGLEQADGVQALVLELVEGPTLADRIAQGAIPLDEALPIARQIAEALEAAHEQGIIHRDLKPANVKIRSDGVVKVLDFGLAKVFAPVEAAAFTDGGGLGFSSPTITSPAMTIRGTILGTAAYMSPEQAKGKAADRRSDVWAFGCVLYEMLAGVRPFTGDDVSDTLASVLRAEPAWSALPAETPDAVQRLLRRSLEKDRRRRLPDIAVARLEIDDAMTTPATREEPLSPRLLVPTRPLWKRALPSAVTAIVVGALAGAAGWTLKPSPPLAISRSSFTLPDGQQFTGNRGQLAISPDGAQIVYVANGQLYLRSMAELEARPIPGTESTQIGGPNPVFAPDGASIAFFLDGTLKRTFGGGGAATTICEAEPPIGMSWGPQGIVFGQRAGIMRVSENGGRPQLIVSVKDDEVAHGPQMLRESQAVLFTLAAASGQDRWDKARIVVHSLDSGDRKILVEGGSDARYLSTGHIVYASGVTLFAIPFDEGRLEVTGEAVPIVEGVRRGTGGAGTAQFSVSNTGSLVFIPAPSARTTQRGLVLIDRRGDVEPLTLPAAAYESPRVSPDGQHVAVTVDDGKEASVWIHRLSGTSSPRRLTSGGKNRFPIWSADGQRVAFQSDREGDLGIFWQRADGTDRAERLTKPDQGTSHIPESWAPTSDRFLFSAVTGSRSSLMQWSLQDKRAQAFGDLLSSSPLNAVFSPDGRWVAYTLRSGGDVHVYVEPFPATGAKYLISNDNGHHPVWSPDGKELSYRFGATEQVVVSVSTQPTFTFGNPVRVRGEFAAHVPGGSRNYDMMRDGKRFIIATPIGAQSGAPPRPEIQIVLNWSEELRHRVPLR